MTGDQQPPQAQATAPPAAAGAASGVSTLRQVCTAGIFILLAAGALALLVFLFRRWRATSETNGVPAQPAYDELDTIAAAEQAQARWPAQETVVEEVPSSRGGYSNPPVRPYIADDDDAAGQDAVQPIPLRPVGQAPVDPSRTDASAGRPPVPPPPAAAAAAAATANGNLKRLVENTAMYQMGEPDYDEAFDINDPVDGYMGQCGLQLIEPFGRERDQAVALQVWLWDSSDPDTQTTGADERGRVPRHRAAFAVRGRAPGRIGASRHRVRPDEPRPVAAGPCREGVVRGGGAGPRRLRRPAGQADRVPPKCSAGKRNRPG